MLAPQSACRYRIIMDEIARQELLSNARKLFPSTPKILMTVPSDKQPYIRAQQALNTFTIDESGVPRIGLRGLRESLIELKSRHDDGTLNPPLPENLATDIGAITSALLEVEAIVAEAQAKEFPRLSTPARFSAEDVLKDEGARLTAEWALYAAVNHGFNPWPESGADERT